MLAGLHDGVVGGLLPSPEQAQYPSAPILDKAGDGPGTTVE